MQGLKSNHGVPPYYVFVSSQTQAQASVKHILYTVEICMDEGIGIISWQRSASVQQVNGSVQPYACCSNRFCYRGPCNTCHRGVMHFSTATIE